jgi:hypothetical protein
MRRAQRQVDSAQTNPRGGGPPHYERQLGGLAPGSSKTIAAVKETETISAFADVKPAVRHSQEAALPSPTSAGAVGLLRSFSFSVFNIKNQVPCLLSKKIT